MTPLAMPRSAFMEGKLPSKAEEKPAKEAPTKPVTDHPSDPFRWKPSAGSAAARG